MAGLGLAVSNGTFVSAPIPTADTYQSVIASVLGVSDARAVGGRSALPAGRVPRCPGGAERPGLGRQLRVPGRAGRPVDVGPGPDLRVPVRRRHRTPAVHRLPVLPDRDALLGDPVPVRPAERTASRRLWTRPRRRSPSRCGRRGPGSRRPVTRRRRRCRGLRSAWVQRGLAPLAAADGADKLRRRPQLRVLGHGLTGPMLLPALRGGWGRCCSAPPPAASRSGLRGVTDEPHTAAGHPIVVTSIRAGQVGSFALETYVVDRHRRMEVEAMRRARAAISRVGICRANARTSSGPIRSPGHRWVGVRGCMTPPRMRGFVDVSTVAPSRVGRAGVRPWSGPWPRTARLLPVVTATPGQ